MTRNLRIFILLDIFLSALMLALTGWYFENGGSRTLVFIVGGLIYTLVVSDLIHRLSGVPKLKAKKVIAIAKPSDLTHQQFETLNVYWSAELAVYTVVGLVYIGLFQRHNWHVASLIFGFIFAGLLLWFMTYIDRRGKIKGYNKKDLFQ